MMRLKGIRIRNYRSIGTDQYLPISNEMTLVGPNNSGKTNVLRAIQTLFTGFDNQYGYTRNIDLTFGVGNAQTSIVATFDGDPNSDTDIYQEIDELHSLQSTTRKSSEITLTLYFTKSNTPVYSFFPNIKRPRNNKQATQYSRTHRALVNTLLSKFKIYYVPSAKSVEQIYGELVVPFLKQSVSEVIKPYVKNIKDSLDQAALALNRELELAQIQEFYVRFALPNRSVEELVSRFDLIIADPQETPASQKGMGIQTTALLAAFRWISQQGGKNGHTAIWLLEEPESYLHPALATQCNILLENLASDAIVIKTTHAMSFVPQNPKHIRGIRLTEDKHTEIYEYRTFADAISSIRTALGIRFGDFYNLARYNVFVEGPSDREILQWMLRQVPVEQKVWRELRQAKFEDFGGVSHLAGFLRATYQFIRQERACVTVLDGDHAGEKARRELQQYFGQKEIPFTSNLHFVSIRSGFAIEGLFPDEWIIDLYHEHRNWFDTFSQDASGNLEPFTIKTGKKSNAQNYLRQRAEKAISLDWAVRFLDVGDAINVTFVQLAA